MATPYPGRTAYALPRPSLKSDATARRTNLGYSWSANQSSSFSSSPLSSPTTYSTHVPLPPTPHVHFPPTPGIAQVYPVWARSDYDRSSAVVLPNECAMPARGCPGRTHYAIQAFNSPCPKDRVRGRASNRIATPGPSRAASQSRMSPPPSPSFYTPHLFYTNDDSHLFYFSPVPSPRMAVANIPPLVADSASTGSSSDENPATPPSPASNTLPLSGFNYLSEREPYIQAANHAPIPRSRAGSGLGMVMGDSVFAITNALNGLNVCSTGYPPSAGAYADAYGPTASAGPKKSRKVQMDDASVYTDCGPTRSSISTSPKRAKFSKRMPKADDLACLDGF